MKVLEFIYNEKSIGFDPVSDENVMVNATEMAKAFGKDVYQFTRIDDTKNFIIACLKPQFCGLLGVKNEEDLIVSRQKSGTWMHRILALKFATWLDPDFHVWVYLTIDKILLDHYREVKAAVYEKMKAEQARDKMRERLIKENPEFLEFLELEGKITESEKKRQKALKASMNQFRIEFQNL